MNTTTDSYDMPELMRGTLAMSQTSNGVYTIDTQLWLPRDLASVFAFYADAHNLQDITPGWLHFQVLTPASTTIKPGTRIDYRLRLHGFPIRWQSEITHWHPPTHFTDEQRRGPYRLWRH